VKRSRIIASSMGFLAICSVRVAFADAGTDAAASLDASGAEAGAAGDGALPPDGAVAPPLHIVGKPCTKDSECATGLHCFTTASDSLGSGGPAGGLCSLDCAARGQPDCARVDGASVCSTDQTGKFSFCLEQCDIGTPDGGAKCHDRPDMACTPPQFGGSPSCVPTCRGDYDCAGRVCAPLTGLCSATKQGTSPIGAACDPDGNTTDCMGSCVSLGNSLATTNNSFCTSPCALGSPGQCGHDPASTGPTDTACVFAFSQSENTGDVGDCGQLCDCDSDCRNPGFICNPKDAQEGRMGACVPKLTFNGVTPGLPCGKTTPPPSDDAGPTAEPDSGAAPDAGATSPATQVSATGGCDCDVGRGGSPRRGVTALALLGIVATLRARRARAGR
jgi:hypothetical protein